MDKLIIDTPEQVHLEFLLAGIGSRFMAALLDTLIQAAITIVIVLISMFFLAGLAPMWAFTLIALVFFAINWGYYASFETLWKGQTPGKRWAGIRVIKESGRPINVFEAISRNFVRIVDYLPGFYGVGVVTMLLNNKHRRLGDFVAGTLVVHETSERDATPFFNTQPGSDFVFPQAANLTLQEAELIETFLARRLDITSAIRHQSAERIAQMVSNRLAIPPDARPADTEAFLEMIVREFRTRARYR